MRDPQASRRFYTTIAPHAGLRLAHDEPGRLQLSGPDYSFSLVRDERPLTENVHLAFPARGDATVRAFHAAALAVGQLPESEQFDVEVAPGFFRHVEFVSVSAADNGPPVDGQPVDRAVVILLFTETGQAVCAGRASSPALLPLESGNVVVHDTIL